MKWMLTGHSTYCVFAQLRQFIAEIGDGVHCIQEVWDKDTQREAPEGPQHRAIDEILRSKSNTCAAGTS